MIANVLALDGFYFFVESLAQKTNMFVKHHIGNNQIIKSDSRAGVAESIPEPVIKQDSGKKSGTNNFRDNFDTLDMSRTCAIGEIKMSKTSRACLIFHN
jgi:hypothetical protein